MTPKLIVHLGTGKTATTYLQNSVFPALAEAGDITYLNKSESFKSIAFVARHWKLINTLPDTQEIIETIRAQLEDDLNATQLPCLLSLETLMAWDPFDSDLYARLSTQLFKNSCKDTLAIIAFRDTREYIKSVYMQMLSQYNINKSPDSYFLSKENYIKARELLGTTSTPSNLFSLTDLHYIKIAEAYSKAFDTTYSLTMTEILDNTIWNQLGITERNSWRASTKYTKAKKLNRSYSDAAHRLTLWREHVLNSLELKSRGSVDIERDFASEVLGMRPDKQKKFILSLVTRKEERKNNQTMPKRLFNLACRPLGRFVYIIKWHLRWQDLMKRYVNELLPYKKSSIEVSSTELESIATSNEKFLGAPLNSRIFKNSLSQGPG